MSFLLIVIFDDRGRSQRVATKVAKRIRFMLDVDAPNFNQIIGLIYKCLKYAK